MNALLQEGLLATKNIQHAAIIKKKEGTVKAKSNFFSITAAEFESLENAFEKPGVVRAPGETFKLMDGEYKVVRADKQSIYGKCEKTGRR
jgi:profilin